MADMASRLRLLEKHVSFIMNTIRMRAGVVNPSILGPDGQPIVKVIEGTLFELYTLSKQQGVATTTEADEPNQDMQEALNAEEAKETVNG